MKKLLSSILLCAAAVGNASASTLDKVREAGVLNCGVSGNLPGFSAKDVNGYMQGFDADYCRAVAAAVGVDKVNFVSLSSKERLQALAERKIDLLSRTTTWTLSRDRGGFDFVGSIFYDGEGFMVPANKQYNRAEDFEGAKFCVRQGTTTDKNLANYFGPLKVNYSTKWYKDKNAVDKAYLSGDCDVYVLDASALASIRNGLKQPNKHKILDMRISKEPLSPVVREGDDQWLDISRWTLFLLFSLEERNISQQQMKMQKLVDASDKDKLNQSQLDFLKRLSEVATHLGLDEKWAERVAGSVGNYEDIFSRHLGRYSSLKMERGLNRLWTQGGLLYAPPFN